MPFSAFLVPTDTLDFGEVAVGQRAFRNVQVRVVKSPGESATEVTVRITTTAPPGTLLGAMNDGPAGWQPRPDGAGPYTQVLTFGPDNTARATLPLLFQVVPGAGAEIGEPITGSVLATTTPVGGTDTLTCSITPVDPIDRAVAVDLVIDCTRSMGAAGLARIKSACQRVLPAAGAINLLTAKDWLGSIAMTRTGSAGRRRISAVKMCSSTHISTLVTQINALTLDPDDTDGDGTPDESEPAGVLVSTVRNSWTTVNQVCECAPAGDKRAVIVFTDGTEANTGGTVSASAKVFPIGVAGEAAPNVAMLNTVARGASPLVLTAEAAAGTAAAFLLDKYLLQVLASLFGLSIALDPDGTAPAEQELLLPFWITSLDTEVKVLLLTDDSDALEVDLAPPDELRAENSRVDFVRERSAARISGPGFTALSFTRSPAEPRDGSEPCTRRNGKWSVRLRCKGSARERTLGKPQHRYSLVVLTRSTLKFETELRQDGCSVGCMAYLTAVLTEGGGVVPPGRALVHAEIQFPDGGTGTLDLTLAFGSRYQAEFRCTQVGVYRVKVQADGVSSDNERFHREAVCFAHAQPNLGDC